MQTSKLMAFETEYDFYFQNNQGMFVVQSQLKYMDLHRIIRSVNIRDQLINIPLFEML